MVALPNLTGRTALVTGASGGVGLEIVRALATAGAAVIMPVRDRAKGRLAAAAVRETVPDAALSLRDLDLASLDSVRALAVSLADEAAPIDLYVMNAGIVLLGDRVRHTSPDGFELHFATNFLGHFALTLGMLPLLHGARVAVQCSAITALRGIAGNDLQSAHRYSALRAYASSKAALGLFAVELSRRAPELTVQLCQPGIAPDTGIAPDIRARLERGPVHRLVARIGNPPSRAAEPALVALTTDAASPALFGPSGFLHLGGEAGPQRMYRRLADPVGSARIWTLGEQLSGAALGHDVGDPA
jgi:NAD(P)-dependent dehydrogenase (short-subunit alcohol dehydrogenase family)